MIFQYSPIMCRIIAVNLPLAPRLRGRFFEKRKNNLPFASPSIRCPPVYDFRFSGLSCCRLLFQFTPLREGLRNCQGRRCTTRCISIHAPARGASEVMRSSHLSFQYFNSRPCERGFQKTIDSHSPSEKFQFTPLREGLPPQFIRCGGSHKFQFTALREGILYP